MDLNDSGKKLIHTFFSLLTIPTIVTIPTLDTIPTIPILLLKNRVVPGPFGMSQVFETLPLVR